MKRNAGGAEVWQVYGLGGELLAEYAAGASPTSPRKEYGYRGGELLVTAEVTGGWGAPPSFTGPDPLKRGDAILLEHLTDLREAVNRLRQRAGLAAYSFTVDPEPVRKVTKVKAEHIRQLRAALEAARSRLGLSTGGYEHATLTENVSPVYAKDFQELRDQIRGAWGAGSAGADIRWVVSDQLGTPRMVVDRTGSLAGVTRHDYFPFGEELGAGVGGRTTTQGYSQLDGVRMKYTGAERDDETGLDFMQARYYSSTMGRFTSPDDFLNDSDLLDPQSWNKYAYVRNNPLKYIDPTGEKADVKIETDEKNKTGTITITASIGIYTQGISQEQLNQARDAIEKSIEGAWSGTFKGEDGLTYTVKTDVSVQVFGSEGDAMKAAAGESGIQNVIGISKEQASGGEVSKVESRRMFQGKDGPDVGTWHYASIMERNQAAHEFTHVLGANNTNSNRAAVSFAPERMYGDTKPVSRYGNATTGDYRWALGGEIYKHRQASRPLNPAPIGLQNRAPYYRGWGRERNHTSTRTVVCCN